MYYTPLMEIFAFVHPRSSSEKIESMGHNQFQVYVTAPPAEGKANQAALVALARYLKIRKNQIFLVRGEKSKRKVFEIKP